MMMNLQVLKRGNFGVALAISVGGILCAYFTIKRTHNGKKSTGNNTGKAHIDSSGKNDDLSILGSTIQIDPSLLGDHEGLLLPEFNELVSSTITPKKNDEQNSSIKEGNLGQEPMTVMELNNCVRLHNHKIESLVSHNRRLEAQLAAYTHLVKELDAEKAKTKLLRKKLKSESEQNYREHILALQHRVKKLQEHTWNDVVERPQDEEKRELQVRLDETKQINQTLKQENNDLNQRLEYVQMLANSALESEEINELREESRSLKQQNEELRKEIERIQADRWSDIEELVHLRWINTCLRYELRNYKANTPDDIGKLISPRMEERAKQHAFENSYKETEIIDIDRCPSVHSTITTDSGDRDRDRDRSDESPAVAVNKIPTDKPSTISSKSKVISKLRRLFMSGSKVSQKKSNNINNNSSSSSCCNKLERAVSVDNLGVKYSSSSSSRVSVASSSDDTMKSYRNMPRRSFDLPRSSSKSTTSMRNSDVGTSSTITRMNSLTDEDVGSEWSRGGACDQPRPPLPQSQSDAKDELLRYAEALKNSRGRKLRGRSGPAPLPVRGYESS